MNARAPAVEPAARSEAPSATSATHKPAERARTTQPETPLCPTPFNDALVLSDAERPEGISDANHARALLTHLLINQLAPALGFDPKRITIQVDAGAEARINARGARALQEGSAIYLHPRDYDPAEPEGRFLLAHEAAHVAQRGAAEPGTLAEAEREAETIGRLFAEHAQAPRPRIALDHHVQAAFEGPSFDASQFTELVKENHREEMDLMRAALSYGAFDWAITDGDINDVLRILESAAYPVQVEMVAALGDPFRGRIAGNISEIHFSRYRTSILAVYDALPGRHAEALQDNPFKGMSWVGLTPQEHAALQRIIENFRETTKGKSWYADLKPAELAHVQDIRSRDPALPVNQR